MTKLRCAIYTRKSTEEGLDMAFNSLDAQREACEAYVRSQRAEGWIVLPTAYDDGGYSGGSMERPGLRALLTDVQNGLVDIVVVYKVDRLTRSLTDFARIVDVLDAAAVSFVSVTQSFNTTTSMGRLTLNVLLSFAQFEREVIAERVRDKVAQSKARGIWMGGRVPYGYRVADRRLIPEPSEAAYVGYIFETYLMAPSIRDLKERLDCEAASVTAGHDADDRIKKSWGVGGLRWLLANPIYVGKVRHRDQLYEGEHEAIVPSDLWEQVQTKLNSAGAQQTGRHRQATDSLLLGMLVDASDRAMTSSHTLKDGRRYAYYVSSTTREANAGVKRTEAQATTRISRDKLDHAVRQALLAMLTDSTTLSQLAPLRDSAGTAQRLARARTLMGVVKTADNNAVRTLLQQIDLQIVIGAKVTTGSLDAGRLVAVLDDADTTEPMSHRIPLNIPLPTFARGKSAQLIVGGSDRPVADKALVALLARARKTANALLSGAVQPDGYAVRIARLAFLAPDIVEAIMEGRHPPDMTARKLLASGHIPLSWTDQRTELGITTKTL